VLHIRAMIKRTETLVLPSSSSQVRTKIVQDVKNSELCGAMA
jgi:hypothetical protein